MNKRMVLACSLAFLFVCGIAVMAQQADQTVKKTDALKTKLKKEIDANPVASAEMKAFAKNHLVELCFNPVFVREVKAQNAKGTSLDDIKKVDEQWTGAEDELPIHKEKMTNTCAKEVKNIVQTWPLITEAFVMDNQGANVGQNALTSDYWQGDEPKWQNSYKDGAGGVDISKESLDKSTNLVDQKVSLPVVDEKGEVVGAVCFGLNKTYAELVGKLGNDIDANPNASEKLKAYAKAQLVPLCMNQVFAKEVDAQNTKGASLDDIKKIDEQWVNAEDELPIHKEKLSNPCAREIEKIVKVVKIVGETFVMDNKGANVGQNALTSDYWQGDEPKWQNSFKDGKGGVDVSEEKLDKSTNAVDQKVSLPIINKKGVVIGAVCFGVNTVKL